ncbi:MAG: glycosyltransferase [Saprospiraceae bacterium]
MRIIITVTTDIHYDQRVCKIANSLTNAGHSGEVIGRYKLPLAPRSDLFQKRWIHCWFKRSFLFYAEFNIRLVIVVLFKSCDAIYACDLDTLLAAGLVSKIRNKKLIFDAHEYLEESVELRKKKWISSVWSFIGKLGIPWTDERITVSDSLADELQSKYKLPFQVIRNLPYFQNIQPSDKPQKIIWYQGALNEGRGLELVLECMNDLPEYRFHLAGTGDIMEQLKLRTKELGLENRVQFFGRLSYEEMLHHAQKAFVGIDLLESDSKSYWFSLSNKTFDYMQALLPSIQMNFPEYQQIQNQFKTSILLKELSRNSFIDAIMKFENTEFYFECKKSCSLAKEKYHWKEEEKILLPIFCK